MRINSLKFYRNLVFLLLIIYFSQGALYPTGSLIAKTALLLVYFISIIFLIKALLWKSSKQLFFVAWTTLLFLNVVGFLFSANFGNSHHTGMFRSIMTFLLPFYPFYYLARKDYLNASHLIIFFIIMLPLTILKFLSNEEVLISERITNDPDVVNNVGYAFVALMPFIFLIKRRLISSGLMMLVMFFVIQSSKRGAIIAGAICLLVFFYYQLRTIERKYRFQGFFLGMVGIIALAFFSYRTYINNEFLVGRVVAMTEGHTSNRDIIYSKILESWYNSDNILNLVFGYGFSGSLKLSGGRFAHNDWLELLSNFGLVGISVYLFLFYAAIKAYLINKWQLDKRILIFNIILIWFFITLISMSYTSLSGYTQGILLAYLIGSKNSTLS